MIEKRKRIAERYQEELKEVQEYITLPNYTNDPCKTRMAFICYKN